MRILFFILLFISAKSLVGQRKWSDIDKADLDTTFFDREILERLEINRTKFVITNKMIWTLHNVAIYNSYIGKLIKDVSITPKFKFQHDSIAAIEYFMGDKKISIVSEFKNKKNGFVISLNGGQEGHYYTVNLTQYQNSKMNGLSCSYYGGRDTFFLTKQYYLANKPVGKYYSYNQNGTLKEEGDSLQAYNFGKTKLRRYNELGEFVGYELKETYDTMKKGSWKYYDATGNLFKEEYFE